MERGEISLGQQPEEQSAEESLRPQSLEEMVGQPRLRENLSVFVQAARARDEPLDHVLTEMATRRVGATLVTRNDEMVGIFTTTDACLRFAELLRSR